MNKLQWPQIHVFLDDLLELLRFFMEVFGYLFTSELDKFLLLASINCIFVYELEFFESAIGLGEFLILLRLASEYLG